MLCVSTRLKELAAFAQQQRKPEQLLQVTLLRQLEQYEEFLDLTPDDLWEELQSLQLAALYGRDGDVEGGDELKKSKKSKAGGLHDEVEEFLIQQVGSQVLSSTVFATCRRSAKTARRRISVYYVNTQNTI